MCDPHCFDLGISFRALTRNTGTVEDARKERHTNLVRVARHARDQARDQARDYICSSCLSCFTSLSCSTTKAPSHFFAFGVDYGPVEPRGVDEKD